MLCFVLDENGHLWLHISVVGASGGRVIRTTQNSAQRAQIILKNLHTDYACFSFICEQNITSKLPRNY